MKRRQPTLADLMDEASFQDWVIMTAQKAGWRAYSIPDSRKATDRGYPDVTLMHVELGRLVWVENKTMTGRVRPDQRIWLSALSAIATLVHRATGVRVLDVFVWRPSLMPQIELYLKTTNWPEEARPENVEADRAAT
jgi:hypothetical protein